MIDRRPLLQVEAFSGGYVDGIDIIHEVGIDLYRDEIPDDHWSERGGKIDAAQGGGRRVAV